MVWDGTPEAEVKKLLLTERMRELREDNDEGVNNEQTNETTAG